MQNCWRSCLLRWYAALLLRCQNSFKVWIMVSEGQLSYVCVCTRVCGGSELWVRVASVVQSFRFLLSQQLCLRLYRVQFPYPLIHNQGQKEDGEYPSVRGRETSSARVDTHRANACKTNSVKVWSLLPVQSCPPPPPQSN